MIPKYSEEEFKNSKTMDLLPCECYYCHKDFYIQKKHIVFYLNNKKKPPKFCNLKCTGKSFFVKEIVECKQCNKQFEKLPNQIKKSSNHFCSSSCSGTYNSTHKKFGTRRSKIEVWLQDQLTILYPDLQIIYNNKEAINSELDIYIPSFKLAIELNGIFHYEPIYGQDKLLQIQNNDNRKFQACLENNIELVIIDSSTMINFKPIKAQKYIDIIINIINKKI